MKSAQQAAWSTRELSPLLPSSVSRVGMSPIGFNFEMYLFCSQTISILLHLCWTNLNHHMLYMTWLKLTQNYYYERLRFIDWQFTSVYIVQQAYIVLHPLLIWLLLLSHIGLQHFSCTAWAGLFCPNFCWQIGSMPNLGHRDCYYQN